MWRDFVYKTLLNRGLNAVLSSDRNEDTKKNSNASLTRLLGYFTSIFMHHRYIHWFGTIQIIALPSHYSKTYKNTLFALFPPYPYFILLFFLLNLDGSRLVKRQLNVTRVFITLVLASNNSDL